MDDPQLRAAIDSAVPLRTQKAWAELVRRTPVLLGRQGIFDREGELQGYELFFRAPTTTALHVDRWSAIQQDRATEHVIAVTFSGPGVESVAGEHRVFVNFTRSYLVGELEVPAHPEQLVVEIVESVRADDDVVRGVRDLRERGFRIALDDFVGLESQMRLLEFADFVKVDMRDLERRGERLVELARSRGARIIAERVETLADLRQCKELGFTMFQGNVLEPTMVLDRSAIIPTQRRQPRDGA